MGGGLLALLVIGFSFTPGVAADPPGTAPATIKVIVPPDAVVEFDGFATKATGPVRTFIPALEPGWIYGNYKLKATFTKGGQLVTVERTIGVAPGKETVVDFTKPDEPKTKIEPKKEEPKKKIDEPKKKIDDEPKPKKTEPKKEVRLDVPYVPTPEPVVEAMLKLANVTDKDVVYDLGCGDGRIVITAVKKFKAKKGLGIELFPDRVKLSKENAKKENVDDKVEIREGSVLDLKSVSDASVVTLYLLPDINLKLMPMLKKTLKPGSRIVSHDFDMGDWKAEKEISVKDGDGREHTIYLWTIPGDKPKTDKPKDKPKKSSEPKKDKGSEKLGVNPRPKTETTVVARAEEPKEKTIIVPYVPTPQKVVEAMLKLAGVKEGDVVYDLGCGDGRIVITAVKQFKAKKGLGVDLNPERIKDSIANAKKEKVGDKLEFKEGDVLKIDSVADANVVTLYLLPTVNLRLAPMLQKTLKPGSRIVSHDFHMGDWKPEKKIEVVDEEGLHHDLYLWTIPAKK